MTPAPAALRPHGRRGRPSRAGSWNDRGVPPSSCSKPSCGLCLLSPSSLLVPPTRECRGEEGGRKGWEAAPAGCRRRERPGARLGAAPAALGSSSSAALPSARGAAHQQWANRRRGVVWLSRKGGWWPGAVPAPAAPPGSEFPTPGASPGVAHLQLDLLSRALLNSASWSCCPCGHWGCTGVRCEGS